MELAMQPVDGTPSPPPNEDIAEIERMIGAIRDELRLLYEMGVPVFQLNPLILESDRLRHLDKEARLSKITELEQNLQFWLSEQSRVMEQQRKKKKRWQGTQGDFARYVVEEYERVRAQQKDPKLRKQIKLRPMVRDMFGEYEFPVYPGWTWEQCYGIARRK